MGKKLIIILFFVSMPVFAGDPHHSHSETVVNNYSVVKYSDCIGLTAIQAANQLHPSENISGLQIGGGIAKNNNCLGKALGAHFNIKGWGLLGGSVAQEGDETIWGAGFNFSLKP